MKCNVRELAHMSDQPCVIEGRLNYKKISNTTGYLSQNVFKERWFRLVNNNLFYYKISELGKFDTKNPAGVFVMENSSVDMEHGQQLPFAFTISFIDESEKRHLFAARTEENVIQWVMMLRKCSYEYLRHQLHTLQSKIFSMTGKDPLLLVPRNEGAKLWAPLDPSACRQPNSSFNCHLHTNGAFSLERSKSDIQARKHLVKTHSKTKFFTDNENINMKNNKSVFLLERSKTTVITNVPSDNFMFDNHPSFSRTSPSPSTSNIVVSSDSSIFDNRPLFSRAAPSPPVRKKLSPNAKRNDMAETKTFIESSMFSSQMGILEPTPVPPRRKVSPKTLELPNLDSSDDINKSNEDLIKF